MKDSILLSGALAVGCKGRYEDAEPRDSGDTTTRVSGWIIVPETAACRAQIRIVGLFEPRSTMYSREGVPRSRAQYEGWCRRVSVYLLTFIFLQGGVVT